MDRALNIATSSYSSIDTPRSQYTLATRTALERGRKVGREAKAGGTGGGLVSRYRMARKGERRGKGEKSLRAASGVTE